MDEMTRRQAVAALAGAPALAGLGGAADKKAEFDEAGERKRVLACGLTEAEADCWVTVARAAGQFFDLPKLHPMDDHEVAHAIHIIQHKLLSRPMYRKYKESFKAEKK